MLLRRWCVREVIVVLEDQRLSPMEEATEFLAKISGNSTEFVMLLTLDQCKQNNLLALWIHQNIFTCRCFSIFTSTFQYTFICMCLQTTIPVKWWAMAGNKYLLTLRVRLKNVLRFIIFDNYECFWLFRHWIISALLPIHPSIHPSISLPFQYSITRYTHKETHVVKM